MAAWVVGLAIMCIYRFVAWSLAAVSKSWIYLFTLLSFICLLLFLFSYSIGCFSSLFW